MDDNTDASDEDSEIVLSDDNEVDDITDSTLLKSLSIGSLPPELQILYVLCLVGHGGKDFLAWNLLKNVIVQLEVELPKMVGNDLMDTEIVPDEAWTLFRRVAVSPIRCTQAILLLSEIIVKAGKLDDWAHRLTILIRGHVKNLEKRNNFLALRAIEAHESTATSLIRNEHIKLVLTLAQMCLHVGKQLNSKRMVQDSQSSSDKRQNMKAGNFALSVVELMVRFRQVLWHSPMKDGSIHPNSLEVCTFFLV